LNIQNLERQNFERQNIEHKNCFRQNIEHNIFMPNAIQLRGRWLAIPSTVYMHRSLESGCLTDITYKVLFCGRVVFHLNNLLKQSDTDLK